MEMAGGRGKRRAYLVRLVVVLRIVLENLGLLLVVECTDKLINTAAELLSPVLRVDEPKKVSMAAECEH